MGWRIFDDVGEMKRAPYASQVLLRREGYREIRVLYERFNQARMPLFAPLQHAIEVRDIATLYEQWCYFALVEEIGMALGITPDVKYKTVVEQGLEWQAKASYGEGGELLYNMSWKGYSMRLRPDFSWIRDGKLEVVLDAKFRLVWADQALDDDGDTPNARAKREDLYKMHTYRDALGVRAAVAVYPGSHSKFLVLRFSVVLTKLCLFSRLKLQRLTILQTKESAFSGCNAFRHSISYNHFGLSGQPQNKLELAKFYLADQDNKKYDVQDFALNKSEGIGTLCFQPNILSPITIG